MAQGNGVFPTIVVQEIVVQEIVVQEIVGVDELIQLPFLLRNAHDGVHAQSASMHSPLGVHVSTWCCAREQKTKAARCGNACSQPCLLHSLGFLKSDKGLISFTLIHTVASLIPPKKVKFANPAHLRVSPTLAHCFCLPSPSIVTSVVSSDTSIGSFSLPTPAPCPSWLCATAAASSPCTFHLPLGAVAVGSINSSGNWFALFPPLHACLPCMPSLGGCSLHSCLLQQAKQEIPAFEEQGAA
eukprot:1143905-Pelagomonas_calceolata.AAC.4